MDVCETKKAKVLLVDDRVANLKILHDALESEGYELSIASSGEAALKAAAAGPDLILLDIVMPDIDGYEVCRRLKQDALTAPIPVIFITAREETDSLVEAFNAGGVDYITKPFAREEVLMRVATHLHNAHLTRELMRKNDELMHEVARRQRAEKKSAETADALERADEQLGLIEQNEAAHWGIDGFVGESKTIQQILDEVRQLQSAGTTGVLVAGESGTGKELIARAIHFGGTRARGPFIALNCSTIPAELAESALFGHVRGAFTGAEAHRKGCFALADGGTLFLDEIGDMPLVLQAKLLRVLEEGTVMPVGGDSQERVDVRVVAATNADLVGRIEAGSFRRDLYFRLARFLVHLPPLRERKEDIAPLAQHFLSLFASEMAMAEPEFSTAALDALVAYSFPGNVRELKNMIEHALIKSGGSELQPEHFYFIDTLRALHSARHFGVVANGPLRSGQESELRILEHVHQHGSINNQACRSLLVVEYNQASYLLKKLLRKGMLVRVGERRGAFYRLA